MTQKYRLVVTGIDAVSSANQKEFQVGDVLLEYDGLSLTGSLERLESAIQEALQKTTVVAMVERNQRMVDMLIAPGSLGVKLERQAVVSSTASLVASQVSLLSPAVQQGEDSFFAGSPSGEVFGLVRSSRLISDVTNAEALLTGAAALLGALIVIQRMQL